MVGQLKVIGDRGELRDYVDLMVIELQAHRRVEEGIELYLQRYGLDDTHPSVRSIVLALGHFDDVAGDPLLEADADGIACEQLPTPTGGPSSTTSTTTAAAQPVAVAATPRFTG